MSRKQFWIGLTTFVFVIVAIAYMGGSTAFAGGGCNDPEDPTVFIFRDPDGSYATRSANGGDESLLVKIANKQVTDPDGDWTDDYQRIVARRQTNEVRIYRAIVWLGTGDTTFGYLTYHHGFSFRFDGYEESQIVLGLQVCARTTS